MEGRIGFKEEENNMVILGVRMGKDERSERDLMCDETLKKIEKRLSFWRLRNLKIKGKVLIVNTLFLSKIWYLVAVVSVPEWVHARVKKAVLGFLWDGKPARVGYDTLIGKREKGGLGLLDLRLRQKSSRVKVVKKYMEGGALFWMEVCSYLLAKCGGGGMGEAGLWMVMKEGMLEGLSEFYKEVFKEWGEFTNYLRIEVNGFKQVGEQPIFSNFNILENDHVIFYKNWFDAGIRQLKDIMYVVKDGFLPNHAIVDMLEAKEKGEE